MNTTNNTIKTRKDLIHGNKERFVILFSILLLGCYATISQVLLIREFLVVFLGNELCLGIILGVWLLGVAVGAATGGRIVAWSKNILSVYMFALLAMCVILPMDLILIRVLRHILNVPTGQYIPILSLLISSICIIMPLSFAVGLCFPIVCRVIRGTTRDLAADIGTVYILESIGSLIGGIVFTFVLVSRFQPFMVITVFNCAIFINLFLMYLLFYSKSQKAKLLSNGWASKWGYKSIMGILVLSVVFILLFSGVVNKIDNYLIKTRWNSINPDIVLLESMDSRYENIVVGLREDQYSVFGNGQYNFAFPDDYEYSQIAHLIMTQHPAPKRVLLIGGGMGGLIKEMLKHPIEEMHYIELDPALINLTKKYLPQVELDALSDKRVKVFHVDGRAFVKKVKGEMDYDLIFVNVPDPNTSSLNRFYTLEFFQEINRIIKENGVLAIGISSAVNYLGDEIGNYTGSIYQTLQTVFPYIIVSPGHKNYYFASNTPNIATFDIPTLINRYKERDIKSEYFSEYVFHTLLQPERVKSVEDEIKGRKRLKVNTDSRPVTYFFNLMLWDKFSGGQLSNILKWIEKAHLRVFLVPIFLFLLCRIVYIVVFNRNHETQLKFNSIIAIATTGFAGIALEIILIFAFQNIYGYVYERIGLIIALFMFGLALGSSISNKTLLKESSGNSQGQENNKKERDWIKTLIFLEIAMIVYIGLIPLILNQLSFHFVGSEYVFMLLVIIAGVLAGLEFPIVSKLYLLCKRDPGKTAGMIDSADHTGAFIGAILTGIIFVPIFGVVGACIILMALNLASLLLLTIVFIAAKKPVKL